MIKAGMLAASAMSLLLASAARAADCDNATATLCWKTIEGEKMLMSTGKLGSGENGPASVTISYSEGGKTTKATGKASGSGKSASIGVTAPSNDSTEVSVDVAGSDWGPTEKQKEKMEDIEECED